MTGGILIESRSAKRQCTSWTHRADNRPFHDGSDNLALHRFQRFPEPPTPDSHTLARWKTVADDAVWAEIEPIIDCYNQANVKDPNVFKSGRFILEIVRQLGGHFDKFEYIWQKFLHSKCNTFMLRCRHNLEHTITVNVPEKVKGPKGKAHTVRKDVKIVGQGRWLREDFWPCYFLCTKDAPLVQAPDQSASGIKRATILEGVLEIAQGLGFPLLPIPSKFQDAIGDANFKKFLKTKDNRPPSTSMKTHHMTALTSEYLSKEAALFPDMKTLVFQWIVRTEEGTFDFLHGCNCGQKKGIQHGRSCAECLHCNLGDNIMNSSQDVIFQGLESVENQADYANVAGVAVAHLPHLGFTPANHNIW